MPHSKALEMFARVSKLSGDDWLALLQARRDFIKPYLDSFALQELGSLNCLKSENHTHAINDNFPQLTGDPRFSLKTQGIFRAQAWGNMERGSRPSGLSGCFEFYPSGSMHIWGLTRGGLWVLAKLDFVGELGYKRRGYENATFLNIVEADLPTILEKTKEDAQTIWEELGLAVQQWAKRRRELYDQALGCARMVEIEEMMLSHHTKVA